MVNAPKVSKSLVLASSPSGLSVLPMTVSITSLGIVGHSASNPCGVNVASAGLSDLAQSWLIAIMASKGF